MRAFIYPGQGVQQVGMGKEIYDAFPLAREVFEEVNDALNQKLSKIMFEGPEGDILLTENAQPALMAVSIATQRVLEKESGRSLKDMATHVAGHSLGEYSALCAAGTFSVSDTARLLKIRGQAMQQAVPQGEGAMAALMPASVELANESCEKAAQGQVCVVANDNSEGQVVISGHKEAVERAVELAAEAGAKRSTLLKVSAPFHCPLMQPAADRMAEALDAVQMQAPCVPLIANVTAKPTQSADEIKSLLVAQVTGQVRWRETVLSMQGLNVDQLVEIGTGKVLCGLAKRIDKTLALQSINTPTDMETFIESLERKEDHVRLAG